MQGLKNLLSMMFLKNLLEYVTSPLEYKVQKIFLHFEVNIPRMLILSVNLID